MAWGESRVRPLSSPSTIEALGSLRRSWAAIARASCAYTAGETGAAAASQRSRWGERKVASLGSFHGLHQRTGTPSEAASEASPPISAR